MTSRLIETFRINQQEFVFQLEHPIVLQKKYSCCFVGGLRMVVCLLQVLIKAIGRNCLIRKQLYLHQNVWSNDFYVILQKASIVFDDYHDEDVMRKIKSDPLIFVPLIAFCIIFKALVFIFCIHTTNISTYHKNITRRPS